MEIWTTFMHISKSLRWDEIDLVGASTLSTDFVYLSVSQTCANYLGNYDLKLRFLEMARVRFPKRSHFDFRPWQQNGRKQDISKGSVLINFETSIFFRSCRKALNCLPLFSHPSQFPKSPKPTSCKNTSFTMVFFWCHRSWQLRRILTPVQLLSTPLLIYMLRYQWYRISAWIHRPATSTF